MCNKNKKKNKKHFCKYCLQCFCSERVLVEHEETCLKINGKETVKLKSGSIKFKNYFKQLALPFKIYADFESDFKRFRVGERNNNTSYTEKYQKPIPCSFAYKVVCIDDKLSKPVVYVYVSFILIWRQIALYTNTVDLLIDLSVD